MLEAAVLTYGLLTNFILISAKRNNRAQTRHPLMLKLTGYFLCGFSACTSVVLATRAAVDYLV